MVRLDVIGHAKALELIEQVTEADLRAADALEFQDFAGAYLIDPEDVPLLLSMGVGLYAPDCRICLATMDNGQPAFLATSYLRPSQDVRQLCGFGWREADETISRRERIAILKFMVRVLIVESPHQSFECWIHQDNSDTILAWEIIGRRHKDNLTLSWEKHGSYFNLKIRKKDALCASILSASEWPLSAQR